MKPSFLKNILCQIFRVHISRRDLLLRIKIQFLLSRGTLDTLLNLFRNLTCLYWLSLAALTKLEPVAYNGFITKKKTLHGFVPCGAFSFLLIFQYLPEFLKECKPNLGPRQQPRTFFMIGT